MNIPLGVVMGDGNVPEGVFILPVENALGKPIRLLVFRFKDGGEYNVEISRPIAEQLQEALNRHLAQDWSV